MANKTTSKTTTELARAAFPHVAHNKRRFVRFPAMCRVEYTISARTSFVFTQDLSLGGMQLRNVKTLAAGDALTFYLHLSDGSKPVPVEGSVTRLLGTSAGVTFSPDQEDALGAIHEFINQRLISRAAERAIGSTGSAVQVVDLAMYYCEIDRVDDAIDLYRKSIQRRPQEFALYEQMAPLLLYRIEKGGDAEWALLPELEALVGKGQTLGKSRVLDSVGQETLTLRKTQAQRQKEQQRREKESLLKEVEAHAVQLRAELEKRAEEKVKKLVAEEKKRLEQDFAAKLAGKEVRAQLKLHEKESRDTRLALEQELQRLRKTIAAERLQFDKQVARLAKERQAFDAARDKHAVAAQKLAEHEKEHHEKRLVLDRRERAVTLREARTEGLEQLGEAVEKLHAVNLARRETS